MRAVAMPLSGPCDDWRPWFVVAVTGHPDAIQAGAWMHSAIHRDSFEQPGAADVRRYLDDALWKKRGSHRIMLRCRGTGTGIDAIVRAYADTRKIPCCPHINEGDMWSGDAAFRRDLKILADSHVLVWFGSRESGLCSEAPDPVTLAMWLGIPHRVVPLCGAVADEF